MKLDQRERKEVQKTLEWIGIDSDRLEETVFELIGTKSINSKLVESSKRYLEITSNVHKYSDDMFEDAKYQLEQVLKLAESEGSYD